VACWAMNTDARGMESGGHRCAVFDAITGVALACCHHDDIVLAVAFSLDGRRVTSASRDGSAPIFDVTTGAELARLDPDATVVAVSVSLNAILVATASNDGSALWRQAAADGDARAVLKLAPIEAVRGNPQRALALLGSTAESGHKEAAAYSATINQTITDIHIRQLETAADSGNTDALNFLGLAGLQDGKTSVTHRLLDSLRRTWRLGGTVTSHLHRPH
jgi:hypothetical protein